MAKRLTTEEFVKRAKKVHGDKYNYSSVIYTKSNKKVKIYCKKHKFYSQTPNSHLSGRGCPRCGREDTAKILSLNQDDFIEKSRSKHGDKYDYSRAFYINCKIPIEIICKKHDSFFMNPSDHMSGQGCKICGFESSSKKQSISFEKFLKMAEDKYKNNEFEYFEADYKNLRTKIRIKCNSCGDISSKRPEKFLKNKIGCKKCNKKTNVKRTAFKYPKRKKDIKYFIEKSMSVHGNRYDYSKSIYDGCETNLIIICRKHGEYMQTPSNHYRGKGCKDCANESVSIKNSLSIEDFIEKSIKVHGDRYGYDKVVYKNNTTEVIIKCDKHGEYLQKPAHHMAGHGCIACSRSSGEKIIANFLESNNIKFEEQKAFNTCKNNYLDSEFDKKVSPLFFDFYLPDYNLLIEYNGKQHYKNSEKFYDTVLDFRSAIKRDAVKRKWSKDNNIELLIIPFVKIKGIRNILKEKLCQKNA